MLEFNYRLLQAEVMKHQRLRDAKEWNVFSTILNRVPKQGFYTPKETLEYQIEEYNKNIADIRQAANVAVRSGGRLRSTIDIFNSDAIEQLKKYIDIIDAFDDDKIDCFYLFWEKQTNSIGLTFLTNPVIIMVVTDHVETYKRIKLGENNKFQLVSDSTDGEWLQAYDIDGMTKVGKPFPKEEALTKQKMYDAVDRFASYLDNPRGHLDGYTSSVIDVESISSDGQTIDDYLNEMNKLLSKADIRTCNQCYHKFVISDREKKWYADKGFQLPRKCFTCRQTNRRMRINRERYADMGYNFDE